MRRVLGRVMGPQDRQLFRRWGPTKTKALSGLTEEETQQFYQWVDRLAD